MRVSLNTLRWTNNHKRKIRNVDDRAVYKVIIYPKIDYPKAPIPDSYRRRPRPMTYLTDHISLHGSMCTERMVSYCFVWYTIVYLLI